MNVEFSRYVSDGPGYRGRVVFDVQIDSVSLTLVTADSIRTTSARLDVAIPKIAVVSVASRETIEALWDLLSDDDRDAIGSSPSDIDAGRVRALEFDDGGFGAFMVMGEPQFACLAEFGGGRIHWLNF